jgi:hypothetical protein
VDAFELSGGRPSRHHLYDVSLSLPQAHGDRTQVGRAAVLHLHRETVVAPRVELVETDPVTSPQREQITTAQSVLQAKAILLDQRNDATKIAAIG